jgi:hypothetical protein
MNDCREFVNSSRSKKVLAGSRHLPSMPRWTRASSMVIVMPESRRRKEKRCGMQEILVQTESNAMMLKMSLAEDFA